MNKMGKLLRIVAIILFGLTTAMNLLGGIGTSCVAFSSNVGYRLAFKELMDYRWLYQIFVVTTILIAIAGIWGLIQLVRGGPKVYRDAVIILAVSSILAGVHYITSQTLRGEAAPANVKFYINIFTLVVFLLFKLPGLRDKVDFSRRGEKNETTAAVGVTAITIGALILSVFHWAGPSHTIFEENWTYVFYVPLVIAGTALLLWGVFLIGRAVVEIFAPQVKPAKLKPVTDL